MHFTMGMIVAVAACVSGFDEHEQPSVLDEYKACLQGLDPSDFHEIEKARERYVTLVETKSAAARDGCFMLFRDFYHASATKAMERIRSQPGMDNYERFGARMNDPDFRKDLQAHGLEVYDELGDYYFDEFPDYLLNSFSKYVSPAVKDFLALRKPEITEGFHRDAGLVISMERLGERVVAWDRYLVQYPRSVLRKDAEYYYTTYLAVFLIGLDNTRVFDFATTPDRQDVFVMPEATRRVFQSYIQKYPETRSGKIVAEFYRLAEKSNFQLTREIGQFVHDKNLPWGLGWGPHLR